MKTKISILLMILAIFTLTGCQLNNAYDSPSIDENVLPEENESDITNSQLVTYGVAGFITEITPLSTENNLGTILVEGDLKTNGAMYDKAYVTITKDTIIYFSEEGSFEELAIDNYVQIFFEGPVMESYPVQATAKQINVIEAPAFEEVLTEE